MKNLFKVNINTKRVHEDKVWILRKEHTKFLNVILWSLSLSGFKKEFVQMLASINKLIDNCGHDFTFSYLKEVMRITVRLLASTEVEKSSKIFVKVDKFGWPCIIPFKLRDIMRGVHDKHPTWMHNIARGVLTLLSIHRVFPTNVKPSLHTISDKFTGVTKTLDELKLFKSLKNLSIVGGKGFNKFNFYKIKWIWLESSGPNATIAGWGIVLDALALLHSYTVFKAVFVSIIRSRRIDILLILIFILTIWSIPYMICYHIGWCRKSELGRLSVVYNQAGKARVIAITSYWIQMILKPVHDCIFFLLRNIPNIDGTFDQERPFKRLIQSKGGIEVLRGFDLSAATDRLPLDLQKQVITLLGYDGNMWGDLLGIEWSIPFKGDYPSHIKYEVGQPMGAYSSWAMLALTHHVIVQYASILNGDKTPCEDYCVLGDDVVIANDGVSEQYLILMDLLGLGINRQKSVESKTFTEFAKKLSGFGVKLSPIGAGLIVQTIRVRSYIVRFVQELYKMGIVSFDDLPHFIQSAPQFLRKRKDLCVWAVIIGIYSSLYAKGSNFAANAMSSDPLETYMVQKYMGNFYQPAKTLLSDDWRLWKRNTDTNLLHFIKNVFSMQCGREGFFRIPALFNFLNPAFYLILSKYFKDYVSLLEKYCQISLIEESGTPDESEVLEKLAEIFYIYDGITLTSIDYSRQIEVKDATKATAHLIALAKKDGLTKVWKGDTVFNIWQEYNVPIYDNGYDYFP
jgi:hypothetical protein